MNHQSSAAAVRPEICSDEHLTFLDELRSSGVTNMIGAGQCLTDAFGLSHADARAVLCYWIATFAERSRA